MPAATALPADQQQRLLLQISQFLPLTALLFGWVAASGLALYWGTQAAFGAVQQYFLTGWGALRDWLPFLPEDGRSAPRAR
jgi:YidC/Oxa1 family membrane protein insertase